MGLPIWKDPDEERRKKETAKPDPTAAARSPIRRRPSVHGRRNTRARAPLQSTWRSSRSSPPFRQNGIDEWQTDYLEPRQSTNRTVPPVSTLLESADRRLNVPPPPPPRIEAPNDYGLPVVSTPADTERRMNDIVYRLNNETLGAAAFERLSEEMLRLHEALRDTHRSQTGAGTLSASRIGAHAYARPQFHRSPEPMAAAERDSSRNEEDSRRSNLPTPPREDSEDSSSLFVTEQRDMRAFRTSRRTHPLSNSWRPESPINGLGDRNRSPTPADGWEIMQTTITPDMSLPSADSSFTSAAASQSFTSNETGLTEPDREPRRRRHAGSDSVSDSESDTGSGNEIDDMMRDIDEREATAQYARDMYRHEISSEEGLERILQHRRAHAAEGNKFALANESEEIELGFRLIDEALNSEEGRQRVFDISQSRPTEGRSFEDWIFSSVRNRRRRPQDESSDEEQPCPQPERRTTSEDAAREASAQVHHYFRRFTADSLADARDASTRPRRPSPPPQYEPPALHPDMETLISHDPPEPHPVSPPSTRSQNEVGDLLLSGDEQDLNAVRRVVERLAQRDDVPDEWWMSMGLNLSRTRVSSRSPATESRRTARASAMEVSQSPALGARARASRVERPSRFR